MSGLEILQAIGRRALAISIFYFVMRFINWLAPSMFIFSLLLLWLGIFLLIIIGVFGAILVALLLFFGAPIIKESINNRPKVSNRYIILSVIPSLIFAFISLYLYLHGGTLSRFPSDTFGMFEMEVLTENGFLVVAHYFLAIINLIPYHTEDEIDSIDSEAAAVLE